jgi:hypothetical protein
VKKISTITKEGRIYLLSSLSPLANYGKIKKDQHSCLSQTFTTNLATSISPSKESIDS